MHQDQSLSTGRADRAQLVGSRVNPGGAGPGQAPGRWWPSPWGLPGGAGRVVLRRGKSLARMGNKACGWVRITFWRVLNVIRPVT